MYGRYGLQVASSQLLDLGSLDDAFLSSGRYLVTVDEAAEVAGASMVAVRSSFAVWF